MSLSLRARAGAVLATAVLSAGSAGAAVAAPHQAAGPAHSAKRCSGAGPTSIMIVTAKYRGKDIAVNCNETLEVRLRENRDGGPNSAVWHARRVNTSVVQKSGAHYQACSTRPGCSGTFIQDYFVVGTGRAPIRLYLKAPGDKQPEKTFDFRIHTRRGAY